MKKTLLSISVLLFIIVPIVIPLVKPGFFVSDDGNWMVIRLAAFFDTLRQGQFPVRFLYSLNHGYGYPVTNFLYPLPFYLGSVIHLLGFGFVDSVKILMLLSTLIGAIGYYLFLHKRYSNHLSGIIGAITYSYLPYHLFDLYGRGSIGEIVALGLTPFLFLGWEKIKEENNWGVLIGAVSLAAIISSHNSLAFLFLPLFLTIAVFDLRTSQHQKAWKKLIQVVTFGLGMSLFFWLPALYELQYTKASITEVSNFRHYFLTISNFSNILGISTLLAVILGSFVFLKEKNRPGLFTIFLLIATVFMMLPQSTLLWDNLPLPKIIQFPWRFASLSIFLTAMIVGQTIAKKKYIGLLISLPVLIVVPRLIFFGPERTFYPDSYYSTNDDTTTVKNEYMPRWVNFEIKNRPSQKFNFFPGNQVQANIVYYPGWKAFVDRQEVPISYKDNGLIRFSANPNSSFSVRFYETPLRLICDLVSLAFGVVLLAKFLVILRKRGLP
jgi:nicotinamide riboside transporter PnuC